MYSIAVICMNLPDGVEPTVNSVCKGLNANQQFITLFKENYTPVNCRSALEGVWQFAYQVRRAMLFYISIYVYNMDTFVHHYCYYFRIDLGLQESAITQMRK